MIPQWLQFALIALTPVAAAAGAYAAVKVRLDWHEKELNRAHARLDRHDELLMR